MSFNGSLAFWLREQAGLLSLQQIASIIRKTAYAVQEMHNEQRLYLDLNPYNILLSLEGRSNEQLSVQLAQPGVAARPKAGPGRGFPANSLLLYMAPEQWMGHASVASDQYALAIIAYELLTGTAPFQGPPAQLMEGHLNVQPPMPSSVHQRLSPALDVVLMNALAKRTEDRFPSIFAFAGALEQAMRHPDSVLVSIPKTTVDGILRATLAISSTEALMGTLRTITLPQGRRISIAIPKGAQDGQTIRLDGLGEPSSTGGLPGAVLLTIAVNATETSIPIVTGSHKAVTSQAASGSFAYDAPTSQGQRRTNVLAQGQQRVSNLYTRATQLSPRGRVGALGLLAALLLLIIIGSVTYFSLQTKAVAIPYPPSRGSLVLDDLLQDNSRGYSWPDAGNTEGNCRFLQGAYHVQATQNGAFRYCIAGSTGYDNFVYEVHMTILKGDGGGLIFRASGISSKFYYFRVGRDGSYGLYLYSDTVGKDAKTLALGTHAAVHTGLNIDNILAVAVRGNVIELYVNNQRIASVTNDAYSSGQVGVAATYDNAPTEVRFSNARVWGI